MSTTASETEYRQNQNLVFVNEDDLIYEVKKLVETKEGDKLMEQWFKETREEAEMMQMQLMQKYAHVFDKVKIKVQPHII